MLELIIAIKRIQKGLKMGQNFDINQISIIQKALQEYDGFTSGEKKYCIENLSKWISKENSFDIMISKLAEKSLDVKPFLKQLGLLK